VLSPGDPEDARTKAGDLCWRAGRLLLAGALVCGAFFPDASEAAGESPKLEDRPVIVGGDHSYPPYEFLDKDGKPAGFVVDLTYAIGEVMGMKVEVRLGSWAEARRALAKGEVDILEGTVRSEERADVFEFAPPSCFVHQSVFGRQGAPYVYEVAQLAGKEVIVQKGGFMHDFLVKNGVDVKLVLVDTHADAMRLLASGKHDYALVGNAPGLYLGRELKLSNVHPVGRLLGGQPYGYAARKGNVELVARFAEGLAILKNTGRYQQIYDRWLGALEPEPVSGTRMLKYGAMVVLPLLLILGATMVWSRMLQKEVASRTEELRLRQQQLIQADKMASLGVLVSGIAHEINNPTGLILFNLPVLRRAYQAAEVGLEDRFRQEGDFMIGGMRYSQLRQETPRLLQEMQEGAKRIKRIVEDLKDFARRDSSTLKEAVDLNSVVRAAIRLVDNSIKKATSNLQVDCGFWLPAFRGNHQRIEQVVVNLLLNACQALPDPQKMIRVSTAHDAVRGEVILSVEDEGVGIPAEHLAHLADPFFTTKRDVGGTGLGLSVSSGIVKEHQGRVEFRSTVGAGTTVTVTFPVAKDGP
jgi:signal transduction histidine kinase